MKPITEIIKEFEEIMPKTSTEGISYGHFCAIRDFVRNALKERDEAIREMIEGVKKKNNYDYSCICEYGAACDRCLDKKYNQALDDLLDKIK